MKKILIFASGTASGGGSGFEQLVVDQKNGLFDASIEAVVTNYPDGGVHEKAKRLHIPSVLFSSPWDEAGYQKIVEQFKPDLIVLAGWLKLVRGLENVPIINEHPAPLPGYGGIGMYGLTVYTKMLEDCKKGLLTESALSYHWVNDRYDEGEVVLSYAVPILPDDTEPILQERTKRFAHYLYGRLIQELLNGNLHPHLTIPAEIHTSLI
jgi:phosphoribosylglycinamide formyltransferase-1